MATLIATLPRAALLIASRIGILQLLSVAGDRQVRSRLTGLNAEHVGPGHGSETHLYTVQSRNITIARTHRLYVAIPGHGEYLYVISDHRQPGGVNDAEQHGVAQAA